MGKNLIRNGGFERGDTEFWTPGDHSAFAVSEVQKFKGTYSAKINATSGDKPYIINNDFIKIAPGEAFILRGYGYPSTWYSLVPQVLYYDEGLNLIDTRNLVAKTLGVTQWTEFADVVSYVPGAEYIKIKLKQENTGTPEYTYWDNLSLYKIDVQELIGEIIDIYPTTNIEGADNYTADYIPVFGYKEAVFIMNVTAYNGSGNTLNAKIQSYDRFNNHWYDIATFNQVTSSVGKQVLVVTAGIGELLRPYLAVAGDPVTYTVQIAAILKR